MVSGILLSSLATASTLTCYIGNKKIIFSPSDHILNSMIDYFSQKICI